MAKKAVKPGALAALASKRKKNPLVRPDGKGGMTNLHDMVVESMAGSLTKLGQLKDASGSDWRTKTVKVTHETVCDVRTPAVPMVEVDGMSVFDRLMEAASKVSLLVMAEFARFDGGMEAWLGMAKGEWAVQDVVRKCMTILMSGQGWRHHEGRGQWGTPAWLFPQMTISDAELTAFVKSEVALNLPPEPAVETDSIGAIVSEMEDDT